MRKSLAITFAFAATVVVFHNFIKRSDLYALLPPTTSLYEYFFSGIDSIKEATTTRAHFRTFLSTHSTTLSIFTFVPPALITLNTLGMIRTRVSGFILLIWLIHLIRKIRKSVSTNPFPQHILTLLNKAHAAEKEELARKREVPPPQQLLPLPPLPPPNDLTKEELSLLRFVKSITSDLVNNERKRSIIWSMRGGGKGDSRQQLGFTSTRYHLAFTGYAFALAQSRTPCYVGRAHHVLSAIIEHILNKSVWGYLDHYWKENPNPFQCDENIMWSGHVLQLVTTYEALTGNDKYRQPGGLTTSNGDTNGNTNDNHIYKSDALKLAEKLRTSMNENPTGGIPCEPGLVFFQCNTHPHIGMKMLETLVSDDRDGNILRFDKERRRWEKHAMNTMHSGIKTGAFKMFSAAQQKSSSEMGTIPFGHMGGDGWCLSYYFPWASSESVPKSIWYDITVPILQKFETFNQPPLRIPLNNTSTISNNTNSICYNRKNVKKTEKMNVDVEDHSTTLSAGSDEPNLCCFNLNIPSSAWASSLMPAAAQAGDLKTYHTIKNWLDKYYMNLDNNGRLSMSETIEWQIGNTMQYFLGVTIAAGSSFRNFVQQPKTKSYFEKPLLVDVLEEDACVAASATSAAIVDVYRCYRTKIKLNSWKLHIGLCRENASNDKVLRLKLANVASVVEVKRGRNDSGEREGEGERAYTFSDCASFRYNIVDEILLINFQESCRVVELEILLS
jgi:hypothetical protein